MWVGILYILVLVTYPSISFVIIIPRANLEKPQLVGFHFVTLYFFNDALNTFYLRLYALSHRQDVVTPVVEHWLEWEIAQCVHPMKDWSDDPSHHERTLYISLRSHGHKISSSSLTRSELSPTLHLKDALITGLYWNEARWNCITVSLLIIC